MNFAVGLMLRSESLKVVWQLQPEQSVKALEFKIKQSEIDSQDYLHQIQWLNTVIEMVWLIVNV
jgi:hypothetical protein